MKCSRSGREQEPRRPRSSGPSDFCVIPLISAELIERGGVCVWCREMGLPPDYSFSIINSDQICFVA